MKLQRKDLGATLLMVAIAVAYIGFLIRGEWPPIEDARGMTGTAFVFAVVTYSVLWRGDALDRRGRWEAVMAAVSLAFGVTVYELSDSGAAQPLLAVFMLSILGVWMVKLLDHVGALHSRSRVPQP